MEKTPLKGGSLQLIDVMGTDADICKAARTSYNLPDKPVDAEKDARLINRLMREGHTSPFEMAELKFQVTCPIFVARQWHRHRTASINEISARYTVVEDNFYIPEPEDVRGQHAHDKQMGGNSLDKEIARDFVRGSRTAIKDSYAGYTYDLGNGVARELARINLPQTMFTTFVWKIDLHNLFHFMRLRSDEHAQLEIRRYSKCLEEFVAEKFPVCYEAWVNHSRDAVTLSAYQIDVIRQCLEGEGYYGLFENVPKKEQVELRELKKKLGL